MSGIVVQLELSSSNSTNRLDSVARAQRLAVSEAAAIAVVDWLERQAELTQACHLMRQLGQGLGVGVGSHDVARQHDALLYRRGV